MIRTGSLVRALKAHGKIWKGRYLSVAERRGDTVLVYVERNAKGKWLTASVPLGDVEEVVG